jgi:hypothetical protein
MGESAGGILLIVEGFFICNSLPIRIGKDAAGSTPVRKLRGCCGLNANVKFAGLSKSFAEEEILG